MVSVTNASRKFAAPLTADWREASATAHSTSAVRRPNACASRTRAMAKVRTDNLPDGARYQGTETTATVDIVLSPKRRNRWFAVAHYDAGDAAPVRTLANATVLDPGDGKQRKAFLAGVPSDVPGELVEQLLLYAAEHIGPDTSGWQDWKKDQVARQLAEAKAKAEAEHVAQRAAHLGDLEADALERLKDPG